LEFQSRHAQRTRKVTKNGLAWLNELETKLTDGFEDIKRDHRSPLQGSESRIPVSSTAHELLADVRIEGDSALRLYVPVSQQDYIFLWGNSHFEYCDVRRLVSEHAVQIDQGFIDALIQHGGTYQTGLFSILWSPYMAGRVLKDKTGAVKAICVINAP
jgi:hypothetical protein